MEEKEKMTRGNWTRSAETTTTGLLIIAFGVLYMLKNMQVLDPGVWRIIFSWPMLLVAVGVVNFAGRHYSWGTLLVITGLIFLQLRIGGYNILGLFWPVLIILLGVAVIFSHSAIVKRIKRAQVSSGNDFFEEVDVFGGGERVVQSDQFRGGRVVSVFGGSKIDLTRCTLSPHDNIIEMVAIFGGSTLLVPSDWNVKLEVFNIFGGFSDKRSNINIDTSKTLVIKGVAIFGGGELKSY